MATKAKKTGAARKRPAKAKATAPIEPIEPASSTCAQYVHLRTLLDSVEIGSVRYYLNGADPAEKNKRFEALQPLLMNVIDLVWGSSKKIPCPPGYTNCDGCCVPYVCYHGG